MHTLKQQAITAAHLYSVILSVFDSGERVPEMATGIVVGASDGPILITAGHVLHRFISLGTAGRLQLGDNRFTLQNVPVQLIRFSRFHDMGALKLELSDLLSIGKSVFPLNEIATSDVREGDLVAFVGYPGQWKQSQESGEVSLGSYEFFGPVRTVEPDQFSILVDSTYEIRTMTKRLGFSSDNTQSLGGLSGAPIFSATHPPKLVGWIYEGNLWSRCEHKLYAVHAAALVSPGAWQDWS